MSYALDWMFFADFQKQAPTKMQTGLTPKVVTRL